MYKHEKSTQMPNTTQLFTIVIDSINIYLVDNLYVLITNTESIDRIRQTEHSTLLCGEVMLRKYRCVSFEFIDLIFCCTIIIDYI